MTLLDEVLKVESPMARMMAERSSDFSSPEEMRLTAIAIDARSRAVAEDLMDSYWNDSSRKGQIAGIGSTEDGARQREIIIGAGYHAAVYAATRVRKGFPRPIVLDVATRVGGTFALTEKGTWFLNSRNRPGAIGLAGDRRASLNYIPGAPIQAANLSMADYQTNADMGFAIRATLAKYADVLNGTAVTRVSTRFGGLIEVQTTSGDNLLAGRVIDARGLGRPSMETDLSANMYSFPDFMVKMTETFPLRGMRSVAVIGGGDSGKCAVESLLGLAPQSSMTVTALDNVERIDWYAPDLPTTCEAWRQQIRGRYQGIGQALRPDRFGTARANVFNFRAVPVALPGQPLISGRTYDMVVMAAGNTEREIAGLARDEFTAFTPLGAPGVVATRSFQSNNILRVGPHAYLPFTQQERETGVADIAANAVSMFRTGTKTATLAAVLPVLPNY